MFQADLRGTLFGLAADIQPLDQACCATHSACGARGRCQAGQRLLALFSIEVSGDTILRILRRSCEEQQVSPRVIGVDDWALRRGYTYGTVIVDLEARRVVDLLPDRQTATLQAWLKAHASVEIVSRDRSTEYAAAITAGSPNATQIADCWHLLANTRELAERYLKSIYSDLKPFIVPREQAASFLTSRPSFRRARADAYRGAASCARSEALYQEI